MSVLFCMLGMLKKNSLSNSPPHSQQTSAAVAFWCVLLPFSLCIFLSVICPFTYLIHVCMYFLMSQLSIDLSITFHRHHLSCTYWFTDLSLSMSYLSSLYVCICLSVYPSSVYLTTYLPTHDLFIHLSTNHLFVYLLVYLLYRPTYLSINKILMYL